MGNTVGHADHTLDNVVNISEITAHPSVVENVDGLPAENSLGEKKQSHVRPPPRAIHGEKSQAGHRQAKEVAAKSAPDGYTLLLGQSGATFWKFDTYSQSPPTPPNSGWIYAMDSLGSDLTGDGVPEVQKAAWKTAMQRKGRA